LENKLIVGLIVLLTVALGVVFAPFDYKLGPLPRNPVPVDAIPDLGENQQIVFTEWMGRSPQDVEDQVTYPLTVSLLGVPRVKTIRSYSYFGFSSIYVIFEDGVDFYWSRSRILEKLNSLPSGTLPEEVQPALGPDATALGQVYWYTLEGRDPEGNPAPGWGLEELRSIQDWQVRYALMSARGISEVASVGGYEKEYQIDVDPDSMQAHDVTLQDVFKAIKMSNIDVGARTIEVNRVEYIIRGLGFIENLDDIRKTVVKTTENVPIYVKDVAHVSAGPALRRGALDKEGAQAVGGVVVVRDGFNPLEAIKNIKDKIARISSGLPEKAVIYDEKASREEVKAFAQKHGFQAYSRSGLNQEAWMDWLKQNSQKEWPEWVTISKVTVVPFYDRTGLIYETLGTLGSALTEEILVTIIVVLVAVMHLRSSILISGALPLAVLMCFIAMKAFRVDANIVALSGIAIAIGTIVDMSIIVCENILRHLEDAGEEENQLEIVYNASREVGGAVLTAVLTTIVSFLPVFTMTGAEGKLFQPLAFTKTFALIGSVIIALTIVPAGAHILFTGKISSRAFKRTSMVGIVLGGIFAGIFLTWWVGAIIVALGVLNLVEDYLPNLFKNAGWWVTATTAVAFFTVLLTKHWLPLGPEAGTVRNLIFVGGLIGGLLGFFYLFRKIYSQALHICLIHKIKFMLLPVGLIVFGICFVWLGPKTFFGPENAAERQSFTGENEIQELVGDKILEKRGQTILWTREALAMTEAQLEGRLKELKVTNQTTVLRDWREARRISRLQKRPWGTEKQPVPDAVRHAPLGTKLRWTLAQGWDGLGKEFMPPLDEGSFLLMPTTMPHASIGEALDVLQKQDLAIRAVPEVESVVGKIGRAETPLDPAPISMVETIINYKSEYITDKSGHRIHFRYNKGKEEFVRDKSGELIHDPDGRPYRQWRDHIKSADDIWHEIVDASRLPGTTSAPKLQPIAARLVMLQSGMRAPMGVKVKGPDLESIEDAALQIEKFLKEVPGVRPATVIADRIVGKPYIEIDIDREAIARYGIHIQNVQDVIEVALGGKRITRTVEGRERYGVRVRYMRELRDEIESLGEVLVTASDGAQLPLEQMAEIRYERGPMVIKSEDTFLVGYVVFDKKAGVAEVDVVEQCQRYLQGKKEAGEFNPAEGISYEFAGNYQNQIRARRTLMVVLPLALFIIFLILYFQFRSVSTTFLVFSGIVLAWAGGFMLIWLYNQPWFLDFEVFGTNLRVLFQMPLLSSRTGALAEQINLSVAVWVGFLALFGIASDNGVVIATYLDQSFDTRHVGSIEDIRKATVAGAVRRIRPCLMTSATTILALLPVLTSTGRGSDVMVPMAIPSFGGMLVVLVSVFSVPILYCTIKEFKHHTGWSELTTGLIIFFTGGLALFGMVIYCGLRDWAMPEVTQNAEKNDEDISSLS
jgi:Cu(I)/Ag(I) efflux system membrane protein CusA/SilA